jgi:hypothetical protein
VKLVAYLLKARTVKPEKQPLLANGSETTSVYRQRLGKHVLSATDAHATVDILLEKVVQRRYKEDNWGSRLNSVREVVKKRGRREAIGGEPPFREGFSA